MLPISETELNAYVDGETFPERQALIAAWLAGDPAEATRIRAWRRQNQALKAAFVRILSEPLPADLAELASASLQRRPPVTMPPPAAAPRPAPRRASWDRRDHLAMTIAGSFLAGAGVACLGGLLAGWR